jgi:putative ABC transport system permease protein
MQVVGVVGDLNDWRLNEEPFPVIYRPHRLVPWSIMTIVVRVQGDPAAVADGLRTTLRTRAPGLALPEIRTLGWNLQRATAEPRFHALLMAVFAAAGLALALVGVYGIMAFSVDRRMREIGIRLSLGGDPGGIGRMVLLDSVRLALLGALLGGLGAWIAGRALASLLFRTEASDPLTWAGVATVLFAGTLMAAWMPARRAARVDPSTILGAE